MLMYFFYCLLFLLGVLKENPLTKNVIGTDAETAIKDWLRHASFRSTQKLKI